MEQITKVTDKNIMEAVKNIPSTAEREGWVFTLDREDEALFYAPKTILDKTELFQVTDEYAIYLDKDKNPQGVMIEYYGHNFIEHHPEFEILTDKIFGKKGENEVTVVDPQTNKRGNAAVLRALFERTLITEAVTALHPQVK